MNQVVALATVALVLAATPARALCSYDGQDYAKTTIAQEFKDSRWVVRAKVIAAEDHFSDDDDVEPWTLYRLQLQHAYKGRPPQALRFFTFRNSGGFYLDKGEAKDIGGEYLLFLNPAPNWKTLPPQARDTVFVNYSCGVSGPWAEVTSADRKRLSTLERGR